MTGCETYIVVARCYRIWFIPFVDGDRQGVFEQEEDAVKFAETLVAKKSVNGKERAYEEVIVMRG